MFPSMCNETEDRPAYQRTTEDGSHSKTDYSRRLRIRVAYGKGEGLVTTKLNGLRR